MIVRRTCYFCEKPIELFVLELISTSRVWTTACPLCDSRSRLPSAAEIFCQIAGLLASVALFAGLDISPKWLVAAIGVIGWLVLSALFRMLYLLRGKLVRA